MNNAHLHLILNHLPITFVILGILVMVGGFLFKSELAKRIAYIVVMLGAIFGFFTFYTGENAQQLLNGIDNLVIATHKQTALVFLAFLYILGLLSLVGLIVNWQKKSYSRIFALITILFSFVVIYYAAQTGETGGEIQHSELKEKNYKLNKNLTKKIIIKITIYEKLFIMG